MKRICKITSALMVVSVVSVGSTTSSFAVGESEARAACTGDVFRYCASAIPNLSRIIGCLKQQKRNISKSCQAVMTAGGY
jgi:hypothetical protein